MRGMNKKILISLLTTLVVFITVFATTYAWVGIFTYANTDSFKMNLKVQDLDSNYFLTISSSGDRGTFSDSVESIELERQIVDNYYDGIYHGEGNDSIENIFDQISLEPSTTNIIDNELEPFTAIDFSRGDRLQFIESKGYYKFDLYLSVDTKEHIDENTTGIKANVMFQDIEEALTGTLSTGIFSNGNPFNDLPSGPIADVLKNIPKKYTVDSKNAVRFSTSIYEPISIDDNYSDQSPIETRIYCGGSKNPIYYSITDSYDLGGSLPFEYNTALQELKVIRPNYFNYSMDLIEEKLAIAVARDSNDLELIDANKVLWNKREHESYLGCMDGIQTKIKITICVWFEGWDADCLKLIERQPVSLNLTFTSGTDD